MKPLLSYDDAAPQRASEPPPWLGPAVATIAGVHVLLFLAWLVLGSVLKPYSDTYSFIDDAWRWRDGALALPAYLWAPHVGHHMAWVRLVTALDLAVGSAWPGVAICTAALLAAALVLGLGAWSDLRLTSLRLPSALLCAMLMLSGFDALDANQPLDAPYPFCIAFSLVSLWLWNTEPLPPSREALRRGLAIAAAIAAALGNGAALALWPVLVAMALLSPGRRFLWAGVAAVVGGLFGFAYLAGAGQIADLGQSGGGDGDPTQRILYLFDYVALPWSRASMVGGAVLGFGLCGLAAAGVQLSRLRGPSASDRFAWSLIGFTLVTAVLAAVGRGGLGGGLGVPVRYVVFAAPLQAGVVMLLAPEAERRLRARGGAVAALALGAAGLLLVQQAVSGRYVLKTAATLRAVIADYEAGRRTPVMTQLIFPDLAFADRVEARLRAERIFGKAPQELARPAASAGARTP